MQISDNLREDRQNNEQLQLQRQQQSFNQQVELERLQLEKEKLQLLRETQEQANQDKANRTRYDSSKHGDPLSIRPDVSKKQSYRTADSQKADSGAKHNDEIAQLKSENQELKQELKIIKELLLQLTKENRGE